MEAQREQESALSEGVREGWDARNIIRQVKRDQCSKQIKIHESMGYQLLLHVQRTNHSVSIGLTLAMGNKDLLLRS